MDKIYLLLLGESIYGQGVPMMNTDEHRNAIRSNQLNGLIVRDRKSAWEQREQVSYLPLCLKPEEIYPVCSVCSVSS